MADTSENTNFSIPDDVRFVRINEFAIIEEPEEGVDFEQAKSFFMKLVHTENGIPKRILIDGRDAEKAVHWLQSSD